MACGDLLLELLEGEVDQLEGPLWKAVEHAAELPVVIHHAEWAAVIEAVAQRMEAVHGPDRRVMWLKREAARARNGRWCP